MATRPFETSISISLEHVSDSLSLAHRELYPERIPENIPFGITLLYPWLPAAVLKAFGQAKALALARLADTAASKVMLPFVEEQLLAARTLLGEDHWPYGLASNLNTLQYFLRHHHEQGRGCGLQGH